MWTESERAATVRRPPYLCRQPCRHTPEATWLRQASGSPAANCVATHCAPDSVTVQADVVQQPVVEPGEMLGIELPPPAARSKAYRAREAAQEAERKRVQRTGKGAGE